MITPLPFVIAIISRRRINLVTTHPKMRLRSPWLARLVIGKHKQS
jgi:hypothetical protein